MISFLSFSHWFSSTKQTENERDYIYCVRLYSKYLADFLTGEFTFVDDENRLIKEYLKEKFRKDKRQSPGGWEESSRRESESPMAMAVTFSVCGLKERKREGNIKQDGVRGREGSSQPKRASRK